MMIIKKKIGRPQSSGSGSGGGGGGGGQECGVMGTEVTRWYGGGNGGHVGLMDNIMSECLNRVWTGRTVFFRQPTDQQSLVRFFVLSQLHLRQLYFYTHFFWLLFFFPVKNNNNNNNTKFDLYSPMVFFTLPISARYIF